MFNIAMLYEMIREKVRPPIAIVMGSPRQAAELVSLCPPGDITCYQMDLHQAGRLLEELELPGWVAKIETLPDLWDLPADFQTVLFPVAMHGERELKLDLLEQSFQILRPHGALISLSEYRDDQFLPKVHKKIFKKCSQLPGSKLGSVFWSHRDGDRPRRRHEVNFHARIGTDPSHSFASQPGLFSYGRMDDGARALLEIAEIEPGQAVLDLGCSVGTNGVLATDRTGPDAKITFVDSNVRAIRLAERNARDNGLTQFDCIATATMEGLPHNTYDLVIANPPYYAASNIANLFIEKSWHLLKPGGRLFLVTKQVEHVAPLMVEIFGEVEAYENRGYTILEAERGEERSV